MPPERSSRLTDGGTGAAGRGHRHRRRHHAGGPLAAVRVASRRATPRRRASTAAPAWAWRSAGRSSRRSAARSASTASPGTGSTFWFTAPFDAGVGAQRRPLAVAGRGRVRACGSSSSATTRPTGSSLEEQLAAWSMSVTSGRLRRRGPRACSTRPTAAARPSTSSCSTTSCRASSGQQFARMIRSDDRFAGVRVVLTCAHVPPPDAATLDGGRRSTLVLTAPVMPSALFDAHGRRRRTARSATEPPARRCVRAAGRRRPPRHGPRRRGQRGQPARRPGHAREPRVCRTARRQRGGGRRGVPEPRATSSSPS